MQPVDLPPRPKIPHLPSALTEYPFAMAVFTNGLAVAANLFMCVEHTGNVQLAISSLGVALSLWSVWRLTTMTVEHVRLYRHLRRKTIEAHDELVAAILASRASGTPSDIQAP